MPNYKDYVSWAAVQFGTDPGVLNKIAELESGYNPKAVNNWDSNAKRGTPSKGMFQFIEPTFNAYYDKAAAERPKVFQRLGKKNWNDWRQQALVASWAVKAGRGGAWATYNRALGSKGSIKGAPRIAPGRQAAQRPANPALASVLDYLSSRSSSPYTRRNFAMLQQSLMQPPDVFEASPGLGGPIHGNPFKSIMKQFGLKPSSGDADKPGVHTEGSFHYRKAPWGGVQAYDFGDASNNPERLRRVAAWARANKGKVAELFYDPLGWYIKNGKIYKGSIGGHGDHVHLALNPGSFS